MHNISVAVSVDFIASKAWAYLEGGRPPNRRNFCSV